MKYQSLPFFILTFLLTSFAPLTKDLNEYGKWLRFHGLSHDDFNSKGVTTEFKISWNKYELTKEQKKLFNHFFIYSNDCRHFIDVDSYSLKLKQDASGRLSCTRKNIDTKVQLVKVKDKTSIILLACENQCFPETAIWRTDSWLEIFGFKIVEEGKFIPTIWKVDIDNMLFTEFSSTKTLLKRPESYSENVRLKSIKFK